MWQAYLSLHSEEIRDDVQTDLAQLGPPSTVSQNKLLPIVKKNE